MREASTGADRHRLVADKSRTVRVVACACFLLAICIWGNFALGADGTKRIVIIHSNESTLPASVLVDQSLRAAMQAGASYPLEFFSEFLDVVRFPEPPYLNRTAAFLRDKYADRPADLVVAVGPQALDFLSERRTSIFVTSPLIFAGISEESLRQRTLPSGVTGIVSRFDPVPTLELALRLQPNTRQVVVVTGASAFDKSWEAKVRGALYRYNSRFEAIYLSGLPLPDLLRELGRLPRDTVVLYLSVFQDGTGEHMVPRDVARLVSEAANAPVYALYDTYMGQGVVGGYMDTFEAIGRETGELGLRILAGKEPEHQLPREAATHSYRIDWRQLRRWGLSEALLPPGSIVHFEEPPLWETHTDEILVASGLLLLQALLIVALLLQARQRRRAEESLRDSEERISLAAVSANLGLWRWDATTDLVWATDHCRQIYGLAPQAPLTVQTFLATVHPDDRPWTRRSLERAAATGRPFDAEYRVVLADGSVRWVGAKGRSMRNGSNAPARMTGVAIDITERKQAEEAMRESEARYRVVAETASDAIITIDQKSIILFANPAAEKIFGYSVAEMIGSELTMLMPDYLRRIHRASVERYVETGRRHISWEGVELPGVDKTGRIIPLELSFAEFVSNGQRYFTGIVRNITERKRAEEALRESEERYRNVVETQTELICRYLPDTTLTFVNDAYCRYFGRSRDDLVGTRFVELIPESGRTETLRYVESLIANPRIQTYEHGVLKPDGSTGWQQWSDHVILDSNGRIIEIQGIGRDITELRQAELEAQRQREEVTHLTRVAVLGELSGALAHELNQPLTAILSNAQAAQRFLDREPVDLDEVREILKDIVGEDRRAGEVIRRLRAMLRRGETQLQPLELNDVVTEVLDLTHSDLIERKVTLEAQLASRLPRMRGDRVQLQQVLLNLIVNGCESMVANRPSDRILTIATAAGKDGGAYVSVTDRGAGIAADQLPRLFEPFFTTKEQGLGLGLSICRSIVAAHGGRLWAANNPDRGATFCFVLPPQLPESSHEYRSLYSLPG
jgi:PAS domain S-box-containing protein